MTRLERRYRALLTMLPGWYRAEREDEMVDTFLADRHDDVDLEYSWPHRSEAWAVAVLAVRTRFAGSAAPPRTVATGDAVRLVAVLGLLGHAAWYGSWTVATLPAALDGRLASVGVVGDYALDVVVAVALVAAFALLVTGRATAAKLVAAAAALPGVAAVATATAGPWSAPVNQAAVAASLWITVGCLFAGFHRLAPTPPAGPWIRAAVGAAALAASWQALFRLAPEDLLSRPVLGDIGALPAWAVIVGALVCLAAQGHLAPDRAAVRAFALAGCAVMVLPGRLHLLAFAIEARALPEPGTVPYLFSLAQAAGLALLAAALAVLGTRDLRRLPAAAPTGRA